MKTLPVTIDIGVDDQAETKCAPDCPWYYKASKWCAIWNREIKDMRRCADCGG